MAPDPLPLRGFELALAYEQMRRFRGLPPVDGHRGILGPIAAELPEAFSYAGFATRMNADADGGREPFCLDHQRRQGGCELFRFILKRMSATQRWLPQSRSTTCDTVMPSARAEKFRAIRCLRTGSARAATSSVEGAKRPSIRARARIASMKAWLARGPGPHAIRSRVLPSPSGP